MNLHTDHIRIDPAYRAALQAADLESVERVLGRVEGRVAAWSRTTDTLYVPALAGAPGFYVKRYYYPRWRNRLRGAFRGTFFGMHRGQAEFHTLSAMRSLGVPTVRPVAFGARRIGHFVTACFLITEEVPDARNLTSFARAAARGQAALSQRMRRELVVRLADEIAHMHADGCEHGQLYWRNVLVRLSPTIGPEFFFLDAQPRPLRRMTRGAGWWLRELAHVAVSAMAFSSRTERLRFLLRYSGETRLTESVRQQAAQIERLAQRRRRHEAQRIKMNDLFEAWNEQLLLETRDAHSGEAALAAGAVSIGAALRMSEEPRP